MIFPCIKSRENPDIETKTPSLSRDAKKIVAFYISANEVNGITYFLHYSHWAPDQTISLKKVILCHCILVHIVLYNLVLWIRSSDPVPLPTYFNFLHFSLFNTSACTLAKNLTSVHTAQEGSSSYHMFNNIPDCTQVSKKTRSKNWTPE